VTFAICLKISILLSKTGGRKFGIICLTEAVAEIAEHVVLGDLLNKATIASVEREPVDVNSVENGE